jgi:hypothetical protein
VVLGIKLDFGEVEITISYYDKIQKNSKIAKTKSYVPKY